MNDGVGGAPSIVQARRLPAERCTLHRVSLAVPVVAPTHRRCRRRPLPSICPRSSTLKQILSSPNLLFPTCRPLPPAAILLVASPPHIAQVNLSILYAALSPPSRIVDPDVHWDTQRSVPWRHAKPASSASSQPFLLQAVRPLEERAAAGAGHDAGRQQVSLRLRQQVNAAACRHRHRRAAPCFGLTATHMHLSCVTRDLKAVPQTASFMGKAGATTATLRPFNAICRGTDANRQ